MVVNSRDVTEKRVLEKQFHQAQKMESIGQLAGGIAHDFNNFLSIIIGYCDLLELEHPQGVKVHNRCEEIKKAGHSAASLTRQLLAFSRQQMLEPHVLDLNSTVVNMGKMLRRLIGADIEFTHELDPALRRIKADPGQIEQVVMNLVVNARDAMPHGGKLAIATANIDFDEDLARLHHPATPGPYVVLSVTDNGCGMDAETQARIFEPFFTTKELGKGTGLGLATVYGIVKQSGGYVWVYSEPGLGTTFKLYFPVTGETVRDLKVAPVSSDSWRGTETILVVEDQDALREMVRSFLVASGYRVLEASHPEQALQIARGHKGSIDLLLTDLVMPGMNGHELAKKLTAEIPRSQSDVYVRLRRIHAPRNDRSQRSPHQQAVYARHPAAKNARSTRTPAASLAAIARLSASPDGAQLDRLQDDTERAKVFVETGFLRVQCQIVID